MHFRKLEATYITGPAAVAGAEYRVSTGIAGESVLAQWYQSFPIEGNGH